MATEKNTENTLSEKITGKEISLFLHEGIVAREDPPSIYSLGDEFAKAKKNQPFRLLGILMIFIVVLFGGTFFTTAYIREQTSRIAIDISDFEDLNLAELVALARDAEKNMSKLTKDMDLIKSRMSQEIGNAVANANRKIEEIQLNNRLSEQGKREMIRKIREEQALRISDVKSQYTQKITEREGKIKKLEKDMVQLQAESQQKIVDYETRVHQRLKSYENQLAVNRAQTAEMMKKQQEEFEKKMGSQRWDYDTEIKTLTSQREDLQKKLQKEQERTAVLNMYLSKYRNSLSVLANRTSEHGHVIDASGQPDLLVEVNPIFRIKKGDRGYVLDRKNTVIAFVELTPAEIGIRARVVKRIKNIPIKSFDILLLKVD